MWPIKLSPAQLVPIFQELYRDCEPPPDTVSICFPNCNWKDLPKLFDIVIALDNGKIFSAYPAEEGHCQKNYPDQMSDSKRRKTSRMVCNSWYCRNLKPLQ